jgi:hypothetical protein
VAASGANGAAPPQGAPRSSHGHNRRQQQPVRLPVIVATASKVRIFFMALNLLEKQRGESCFGLAV